MAQGGKKSRIHCIAFAGGGSGGHTYPLLAIAAELKRRQPGVKIFFVSTPKSVEEKILKNSGYEFFLIPSGKVNGQGVWRILLTLFSLPFAFARSLQILLMRRPSVVVSAGGYAGAPFLLSAAICGFPTAVYEQNRTPGLANRVMAKLAKLIFVNFAGTAAHFEGQRTVTVGLPFRREILSAHWSDSDWAEREKSEPFRIFVFGGSQGAVAVSRLVVASLEFLGPWKDKIFIHHQTGQNDLRIVEAQYAEMGFSQCRVEAYVYNMQGAYRDAHLVICRAGASTLAELGAAGKASILIPLVSRDNHQDPNAKELVERGAAILLRQQDATPEKLANLIRGLIEDRARLRAMSEKMSLSCVKDSEQKIIEALETLG